MAKAHAIASRWRPPPERRSGFSDRRSHSPTRRSALSARASTSAAGRRRFSGPNATSSSNVPVTSCASGSWNTIPTWVDSCATECVAASIPATSTRPVNAAGTACGMSPFMARESVDLPEPLGPRSSTTSPRDTSNDTDAGVAASSPSCVIPTSRSCSSRACSPPWVGFGVAISRGAEATEAEHAAESGGAVTGPRREGKYALT